MTNFNWGGNRLPYFEDNAALFKSPIHNKINFLRAGIVWSIESIIIFCVLFSGLLVSSAFGQEGKGLNKIEPLQVGDTIPDYLWDMPLEVVNHPQDKDTIRLKDYASKKLIILDFWAVWCAPCIKSIKYIDSLLNVFDRDQVSLIPVNRYDTKEKLNNFKERYQWPYLSVINNTALDENILGGYQEYLGLVWIVDGKLFAVPNKSMLTSENILYTISGQFDKVKHDNLPLLKRRNDE